MDDPETQQVMAQPQPCLVCKKPVTKPSILMCCEEPCHLTCAQQQQREQNIYGCFRCGVTFTLHVLEILHEEWKKEPQFMKEVKRYWYQHTFPGIIHHLLPLWYGIAYELKCSEPIYLAGDPQFVKKVERTWNGYLWYGICHTDTGAAEGFWGKIFKNPDTISNIPHFLGHTPTIEH